MFKKIKNFFWKFFANSQETIRFENLNRLLSLKNQADLENLKDFFRANAKDKIDNELFEYSINAAQKLGVSVEFQTDNALKRSYYHLNDNKIVVESSNDTGKQTQDLLHELIHSTTRKGFKLYRENLEVAKQLFTDKQIQAFKDIDELFYKSKAMFDDMSDDLQKGDRKKFKIIQYGYKSTDEFLAELSNPIFREYLKKQSLWKKIKNACAKFFFGDKDLKQTNAFEVLKERYFTILDEYNSSNFDEIKALKIDDMVYSQKLEAAYLDKRTDRIKMNILLNEAIELPQSIDEYTFKKQFLQDENGYYINTPIGQIRFKDTNKPMKHLLGDNTYFVNRWELSGAFVETLEDPLFVVRRKYQQETTALDRLRRSPLMSDSFSQKQSTKSASGKSKTKNIIADSFVFYKPFKQKNEKNVEIYHLASFGIDKNGQLLHTTFYDLSNNIGKLKDYIKGLDEDLLYFKDIKNSNDVVFAPKFPKDNDLNINEKELKRTQNISNVETKDIMNNFNKVVDKNRKDRANIESSNYEINSAENEQLPNKESNTKQIHKTSNKIMKVRKQK